MQYNGPALSPRTGSGFGYLLNLMGDFIDVDAAVVCLLLVVTISTLWVGIQKKYIK